MSERRIKKINDLIRDEVGMIIKDEIDFDDDTFVTIVEADTSDTLEHSTIKISVFPTNKRKGVIEELKKNISSIQRRLNKRLVLRKVPKIRFETDESEEKASRIEKILDSIKENGL